MSKLSIIVGLIIYLVTIPFSYAHKPIIPIKPTAYRNEFYVKIHIVPWAEVGQVCHDLGAKPLPEKIGGCALYDEDWDVLEMWVAEPEHLEDHIRFSIIGHELWHGARGKFHSEDLP